MKSNRGWRGDTEGHRIAGAKGGTATARTHGKDFYSRIGKSGGIVSGGNFARNPERARLAGQKGGKGRAKKQAA